MYRFRLLYFQAINIHALLLLTLSGVDSAVTISLVKPSKGALEGGTRLEIQGSGFAFGAANMVYVGPYVCDVEDAMTSSTLISCTTRAADDFGDLPVTVLSEGQGSATFCCYTYSRDYTPTLVLIDPQSGSPGISPKLLGDISGVVHWDFSQLEGSGRTEFIGKIPFGDYRCKISDIGGGNVYNYSSYWSSYFSSGRSIYEVNCELPLPGGGWTGAPANSRLGVAGNVNVSLHFERSLRGGKASPRAPVYWPDKKGDPYMFQIHPHIDLITPSTGSLMGGTVVTLQGRGFPSMEYVGTLNSIIIRVGGAPCQLMDANYTHVQCQTAVGGPALVAENSLPPEAFGPFPGGRYPGMRGWIYDYFPNTNLRNNIADLRQAMKWVVNDKGGKRYVFSDRFESRNYTQSNCTARGLGFFIPPTSGPHRFWAIGDDTVELNATFWNVSASQMSTVTLVSTTQFSLPHQWQKHAFSVGQPLELVKGQPVLLSVGHINPAGSGSGHFQVGVTVPTKEARFFNFRDVQQISVPYQAQRHTQMISLTYPTGQDHVVDIAVTGPRDSAGMTSPYVGLDIEINGVNLTTTSLASNVTNLQQEMRSRLRVNATDVGVRKWLEQGGEAGPQKLTYRIAGSQLKFPGGLVVRAWLKYIRAPEIPAAPAPVSKTAPALPLCLDWKRTAKEVLVAGPDGNNVTRTVYEEEEVLVAWPGNTGGTEAPSGGAYTRVGEEILEGLVVTSSIATQLISGGLPSGDWLITVGPEWRLPGSNASVVGWNATVAQVYSAVRRVIRSDIKMAGSSASSAVTKDMFRNGELQMITWTVIWDIVQGNAIPPLLVSRGPRLSDFVRVNFEVVSNATLPLGGFATVRFGNYCRTVDVPIGATGPRVANVLKQLPGVGGVDVVLTGTVYTGLTYTVTFNPYTNPGSQPLLVVQDWSKAENTAGPVTITKVTNGSLDSFYGPIPGEFLRVPVTQPGSVEVEVNDVPGWCDAPGNLCAFTPTHECTPNITSMTRAGSQTPVNTEEGEIPPLEVARDDIIVVAGTGIFQGLVEGLVSSGITVNLVPDTSVSSSDSSGGTPSAFPCRDVTKTQAGLQFRVGDDVPPGVYQVLLYVPPCGYASFSSSTPHQVRILPSDPQPLVITSISPTRMAPESITQMAIRGSGFDPGTCTGYQVTLSGHDSHPVVSCNTDEILVLVAAPSQEGSFQVVVKDNGSSPARTSTTSDTAATSITIISSVPHVKALTGAARLSVLHGGAVGFQVFPEAAVTDVSQVHLVRVAPPRVTPPGVDSPAPTSQEGPPPVTVAESPTLVRRMVRKGHMRHLEVERPVASVVLPAHELSENVQDSDCLRYRDGAHQAKRQLQAQGRRLVQLETFTVPLEELLTAWTDSDTRELCRDVQSGDASTMTCTTGPTPSGEYLMQVTYKNGEVVLYPSLPLSSTLVITNVFPSLGSIGGGTRITIRGSGFRTGALQEGDESFDVVVVVRVPISTTFSNGVVLCDVEAADDQEITCRARPHLAADSSAEDPGATRREPRSTLPGQVEVAICPGGLSDMGKVQCWSDPQVTAPSTCITEQCTFAYDWSVTPIVGEVTPQKVYGGVEVTFQVNFLTAALQSVSVIHHNVGDDAPGKDCTSLTYEGDIITCTLPNLPSGKYKLRVVQTTGERSVSDTLLTYYTTIKSVGPSPYGSMAGGTEVTVELGGTEITQNDDVQVLISGVPCVVSRVETRQVVCMSGPLMGGVLAQYWKMPAESWTLPDLSTYTAPQASLMEYRRDWDVLYGTGGPAPLAGVTDYFASRWQFYLIISTSGTYSFFIRVDDQVRLTATNPLTGWQYSELVAYTGSKFQEVFLGDLDVGYLQVQLEYIEYTYTAEMRLKVGTTEQDAVPILAHMFSAMPGGMPLTVDVLVNGIVAEKACRTGTTMPQPSTPFGPSTAPGSPLEPSSITVPACTFVYSSHYTPMVTSISPLLVRSGANITIKGTLLADQLADVSVYLGEMACKVTELTADSLVCTAPDVPGGSYDLSVRVAGRGTAQVNYTSLTTNPPTRLSVEVGILSVTPLNVSQYGGNTLQLSGHGFAPEPTAGNRRSWVYLRDGSTTYNCTILAATTTTITCRVARTITALRDTFKLTAAVLDTGRVVSNLAAAPAGSLVFEASSTPRLVRLNATQLPPLEAGALQVTWEVTSWTREEQGGGWPEVGGTSKVAGVFLTAGRVTQQCLNPRVVALGSGTTYQETLACDLPAAQMTAATWRVYLEVEGLGYSNCDKTLQVALQVSSASPLAGSLGGGQVVVFQGRGFTPDPSQVNVTFGSSPCQVMAVTTTELRCMTSPATAGLQNLKISMTEGAYEYTNTSLRFNYTQDMTPNITSITPARGSTLGGTPVTISGVNLGVEQGISITLGGIPCSSVQWVPGGQITCIAGKPQGLPPYGPQPVNLLVEGMGRAVAPGPLVNYTYVDLWSRATTWGGSSPPVEGDTVLIPANTTILLDVSPPQLEAMVIEGTLIFDELVEDLDLHATYILIRGGTLLIGSEAKPFPGRATIVLHGNPNMRELPMFGGKVLANMHGILGLYGKAKVPAWTRLVQTADVGESSIVVSGKVNWEVGDRLVVASSSYNAEDVDEADITGISVTTEGNTRIALSNPLRYTHLGLILPVEGADPRHVMDMRAEVAVLTRNVKVTGDATSERSMYGAHIMSSVHKKTTTAAAVTAFMQLLNVEVTAAGQSYRLGRYPVHFHLMGDVRFQSWVRNCSVHHTYNRAFTIHGTHQAVLRHNVAYRNMGHAFFLEDGIETGNILDGNLGIHTLVSNAMLITDYNPATFWITHPNNTVINNVAAGAVDGFGFWYHFEDYPTGPSRTISVCPKFDVMGVFNNNVAHSTTFYGLRVHPEYYQKTNPCGGGFDLVPAVFSNFIGYKLGVKCAIATQIGLIQFWNFTCADCGGGDKMLPTNGKDIGGHLEMVFVLDHRGRYTVNLPQMSGVFNALVIARTAEGQRGSLQNDWYSDRRIGGVVTPQTLVGTWQHHANFAIINVTFVGFLGGQFRCLETCAHCKDFVGGNTAFCQGLRFLPFGSKPLLTTFSWGHQGVLMDLDGSLLNFATLPGSTPTGWQLGQCSIDRGAQMNVPRQGCTLHSSIENDLFRPEECFRLDHLSAVVCRPDMTFRRVMINRHTPQFIAFNDLLVVDRATNRSTRLHQSKYNDNGYMFTVPSGRRYWMHWDRPQRVDPTRYQVHKMDVLTKEDWVFLETRYIQKLLGVEVNSQFQDPDLITDLPDPLTGAHGTLWYDRTMKLNTMWSWKDDGKPRLFNDTTATLLASGDSDTALTVDAISCSSPSGCVFLGQIESDMRAGVLLWSDPATWSNGRMPREGDDVNVPYGWNLVVDESPPPLGTLVIEGNVTFTALRDITLTANYVIVRRSGILWAGSETHPHSRKVTFLMTGDRDTPEVATSNRLVLGANLVGAIEGGALALHGMPVTQRWTRLVSTAAAGSSYYMSTITVQGINLAWPLGGRLVVASSSYNPHQYEIRNITSISSDAASSTTTISLDQPLVWDHLAVRQTFPGASMALDMRVEVGYLSGSINILSRDGRSQMNGQKYGVRVLAHGPSSVRLSGVVVEYCGQAGLGRPCVHLDRLLPVNGSTINPSYLKNSAIVRGMDLGLWISSDSNPYLDTQGPAPADSFSPVTIQDNVFLESFDVDTVRVDTPKNRVIDNLAMGTQKEMKGKSKFDNLLPASFRITVSDNIFQGNAAGGSDRVGLYLTGEPCGDGPGQMRNNTAHSSLVGVMLEASDRLSLQYCTQVVETSTWVNWDYGVFTVKGIKSGVMLRDVAVADTKHVGMFILYEGDLTTPVEVIIKGGIIAGQTSSQVGALCTSTGMPGCHPNLSSQSYNQRSPFTPSFGLATSTFTLVASPGPEFKPWDAVKGYPTILGVTRVDGLTFAHFYGKQQTQSGVEVSTYAIRNHHKDPDAFHPVFLKNIHKVQVEDEAHFLMTASDPSWRNEGDCGDEWFDRKVMRKYSESDTPFDPTNPDHLPLNCAGPRHVYFRDEDGSFTGDAGAPGATVLGAYLQRRHSSGVDQGAIIIDGPCRYRQQWGAYVCVPDVLEHKLGVVWQPQPVPKKGIFGDPQLFVLESRDDDRETRIYDPVFFSIPGTGVYDLVINAMDQGCCFGYGYCQKRLNAFWTVVSTGHNLHINFTGSPGSFFRLWLPYADTSDEVVVVMNFLSNPNRRYTWLPGKGRPNPLTKPPVLGDGTDHGAHHWDQATSELTVKVKGGLNVEVRMENVLYVTPKLAMSVADFYATQENFIQNMAFVLGIDPKRIRIAKVVAGSAIVDLEIGEDLSLSSHTVLPEQPFDTSNNVDMDTAAEIMDLIKSDVLPQNFSVNDYYDLFATEQLPDTPPSEAPPPSDGSSGEVIGDPPQSSPTAGPAPPTSGGGQMANATTVSTGLMLELAQVYATLREALSNGSAIRALNVTIMSMNATLSASVEVTASSDSTLNNLLDKTQPVDLTDQIQQGERAVLATTPPPTVTPPTVPPPTGTPQPPPPANFKRRWHWKTVLITVLLSIVGVASVGASVMWYLNRWWRRTRIARTVRPYMYTEMATSERDPRNLEAVPPTSWT